MDYSKAIDLYREWNDRINVVSRKDIDCLYEHHILHSLAIAEYLRRKGVGTQGLKFLDVGTGGGFPGIPLACEMPEAFFVLCDSIGKKTTVASAVAQGLGLSNVQVRNCRAESIEETFDYVVSRAVTSLENFYPWVKGRYSRSILYLKGGTGVLDEVSQMCRKCKVNPGGVSVWPISEWLPDDYYSEKYVVEIADGPETQK